MQREVTYVWSSDFVKISTRRFYARYARRSVVFCLVLMAVGIGALILGWGTGFCWLVIGAPVFFFYVWRAYYERALKICKEMPDRHVTLRVEPESITFQTSDRTTILKWSAIKEVWSYPDVLFLFTYGRHSYTAVPTAPLGDDLKKFIEDKVREYGRPVT